MFGISNDVHLTDKAKKSKKLQFPMNRHHLLESQGLNQHCTAQTRHRQKKTQDRDKHRVRNCFNHMIL